ncbi:MAG: peptide deformylase [Psychrobacillus psychrodurans]
MILMNNIVRDGHPSLRKKTEEITFPLSEEDLNLANELLEYVINSQDDEMVEKYKIRPGIGIAAPQVNANKRMFALHLEDENNEEVSFVAVNPKIISHSVEKTYISAGEGCLSVDEVIEGYVPRYARITATGFYPDGTPFKKRLKGLAAIAFQHELDHLNGIMFYDHINKENPYAPIPDSVPYERK